jgi:hypothetical protein
MGHFNRRHQIAHVNHSEATLLKVCDSFLVEVVSEEGAWIRAIRSTSNARKPATAAGADISVNGHLFLPNRGHRFSPLVAMVSPRWWPSNLPTIRVVRV